MPVSCIKYWGIEESSNAASPCLAFLQQQHHFGQRHADEEHSPQLASPSPRTNLELESYLNHQGMSPAQKPAEAPPSYESKARATREAAHHISSYVRDVSGPVDSGVDFRGDRTEADEDFN
jgi:hypothetical protein